MAIAHNLYQAHQLDTNDSCQALGIIMAGRDARLQSKGEPEHSPQRREAQLVFAVLSNPQRRELYDAAVAAGRGVDWSDLEYLANFDCWPDPDLIRPARGVPYAQPLTPHQVPEHSASVPAAQRNQDAVAANPEIARITARPSAGARFGMALADGFIATVGAGMVLALLSEGGGLLSDATEGTLGMVLFSLIGIAYFVGFETWMGGTPVKSVLGYKVCNVETGRNLTLAESAKRQWFRAVQIIPGLGPLVSGVGSLFVLASISPANELRGSHDRLVDAEVTKRPRQQ